MKLKDFSFITSELMLVLVSVGLSIELVKWITPILNGDNFTGIIIVKAVLLIICVSGVYSVLSRLNTLLFKVVDKTNSWILNKEQKMSVLFFRIGLLLMCVGIVSLGILKYMKIDYQFARGIIGVTILGTIIVISHFLSLIFEPFVL